MILIGSFVNASAAQAAKPPIDLPRVGKWVVDYDKDRCLLTGIFGAGDDQLVMRLARYEPGDSFRMMFFGKPMKASGQFFPVGWYFSPDTKPIAATALVGTSGELPFADYGTGRLDGWSAKKPGDEPPALTLEAQEKATDLTLKAPRGTWYRLLTGSMRGTMKAMQDCTTNLIKYWGYDPGTIASLSAKAKPKSEPGSWLDWRDYPQGMVSKMENGLVRFRLDIDVDGTVAKCSILDLAGKTDFAEATCRQIAKRARFEPARDKNNVPTKSYFVSSVRWTIGS